MTDIIIIKSNSIIHDVRVGKIARSLSKQHSVLILGWNREGISDEVLDTYGVAIKCCKIKAPYGKFSTILYLPLFWIWVFSQLVSFKPKVVHACDFDTFLPGYLYKLFFKKKLVFDIFDRYAMANIPQKFKTLYSFVNSSEERFSKKVDTLIIVAENILATFKQKPERFVIIRNCPEMRSLNPKKSQSQSLTLVYTGNIVRYRGLEQITAAVKGIDGVKFVFAGRIIDKEFFEEILRTPNVKYVGHILPSEALSLVGDSDVLMILYDFKIPINQVANPNKTFEAMMFGLPIITNLTPELIHETNSGILVDYNNVDEIRSAIVRLRDNPELRKKLGENGRKAFEEKYNWNVMESKLLKIYEMLLQ